MPRKDSDGQTLSHPAAARRGAASDTHSSSHSYQAFGVRRAVSRKRGCYADETVSVHILRVPRPCSCLYATGKEIKKKELPSLPELPPLFGVEGSWNTKSGF